MTMNVKTFGPVDERSLRQLETCMQAGDAEYGVLCADHHPGYSQPIGGAVAYEGHISPSGVGYDIGWGNKAGRTDLVAGEGDLAREQLGTVGSGNHFVNLLADAEGRLWVGVHFGSRGFGHRTASGFLALARGRSFEAKATEGGMDSPPTLLSLDSELG